MMHSAKSLLLVALALPNVFAQVPVYGQCGGQGYSGDKNCASGSQCVLTNEWYSQCLPGTGPPVTLKTTTTANQGTTRQPTTVVNPPKTTTTSKPASTAFAGYLVSTFSDPKPAVQFHVSVGNDPTRFTFLNRGQPALTSNVGTRGVRDIFMVTNAARSEWTIIATDLDINAPGFDWNKATRYGSRGLVIWKSTNLRDWSGPKLVTVEAATAGMVWAPSAIWDAPTQQYYVFWSSRQYAANDPNHNGFAALDGIRYATTKDFSSFSAPKDYVKTNTPIIDHEFQYLGTGNNWVRYLKDETANRVFQEISSTGLFGSWKRVPGYVVQESPREGPASFADNTTPGKYHLWLDDYTRYVPYETTNIGSTSGSQWRASSYSNFPRGLKHGSVTPMTQAELNAITGRFPA